MKVLTWKWFAIPRSVRCPLPSSFVVSCHVPVRSVSAWICSTMRLMLFFDGPVSQAHLAGSRRIHSSERVAQKIELSFRHLADSCLLLVDRELQLAHDLAQLLQCLIGIAFLAQDHEIVGIGHNTTAKALLQSELLPSQYEPAHVYIRQQR